MKDVEGLIMAGGYGTRLEELTTVTPKPMLPVGGMPLLERIVLQFKEAGMAHTYIAVHYRSKVITDRFGFGSYKDIGIDYITETRPLGTAGAIGKILTSKQHLLVMNGDIVTDMSIKGMYDYHLQHHADLTVASYDIYRNLPYGVIYGDGAHLVDIIEKPTMRYAINAGIYLIRGNWKNILSQSEAYNMTDLINAMIDKHATIVSYPINGYWRDIGQIEDYYHACDEMRKD